MESKSGRMRQLFAQGKTVSEVARLVEVDYPFAYGVAKRAGFIDTGAAVSRESAVRRFARLRRGDGVDIEANLRMYLADRQPMHRYASFDYCFNYFQTRREEGRIASLAEGVELQVACLQLGFYLASWGMYRGSTVLLRRSVAHLAPVINVIARAPSEAWEIDVDGYTRAACRSLLDLAPRSAGVPEGATDTLVTKIMLGVFGSVPAFDTNFKTGFGVYAFRRERPDACEPLLPGERRGDRPESRPDPRLRDRGAPEPPIHAGEGDRHDLLRRRRCNRVATPPKSPRVPIGRDRATLDGCDRDATAFSGTLPPIS